MSIPLFIVLTGYGKVNMRSCFQSHSISSRPAITSLFQCQLYLRCLMMVQILGLAHNKEEIAVRVHSVIDKFAERGLRSLAVARQASASSLSIKVA